MTKCTQVTLGDLFPKGSGRAPQNTRIQFQPDGLGETVTATVKKRTSDGVRVEFPDPRLSNSPTRVTLSASTVVTKLG